MTGTPSCISPDETLDTLDSFQIIQKKTGYRFSSDSVLLAHFILPLQSTDSVIDLGTGSGVIPLILAQRSPACEIVGVEIQKEMAGVAQRNVDLNNLSSRVRIIHGDFKELMRNEDFKRGSFSVVISNPPYMKCGQGRISPSVEKAAAKMEIRCCLCDVVQVSRHLVADNGRIVYIYPAERLQEMVSVLQENRLTIKRLERVCSKPGSSVKRFLIEAAPAEGEDAEAL